MSKQLNTIESVSSKLYSTVSAIGSESFLACFHAFVAAFNARLLIERERLGEAFNAESFWSDNTLSDEIIESASRKPVIGSDGKPVLVKGKPKMSRSRFNRRTAENASQVIRRGCRSFKSLKALLKVSETHEQLVHESDRLGSILNLARSFAESGLVKNNREANDAKNAAIEAFEKGSETRLGEARRAFIGSLVGKPVTTKESLAVIEAHRAFMSERAESRANKAPEPKPLTFAGIFKALAQAERASKQAEKALRPASLKRASRSRKAQAEPVISEPESKPETLELAS